MEAFFNTYLRENIFDILLIIISASACFYCWSLNRRLKKLQDLDSGLGASLVKLTSAITKTNNAALEARKSTVQTVTTLKSLLRNAEETLPQIEGRLESLRNSQKNAQATSKALLRIVSEVQSYERKAKQINQDRAA